MSTDDIRALEDVLTGEADDWVKVRKEVVNRSLDLNTWQNRDGHTMLQLGVFQCHFDVVQFLLERRASPNSMGGAGKAQLPLVAAVYNHSANMVNRLLAFKADPLKEDGYRETALAVAYKECPGFAESVARPFPTLEQERGLWHFKSIEHAGRWNVVKLLEEARLGAVPALPSPLEVPRSAEVSTPLPQQTRGSPAGGGAVCSLCARPGALLRCGHCHGPTYCDRECQQQHWRQSHSKQCNKAARVEVRSTRSRCGSDACRCLRRSSRHGSARWLRSALCETMSSNFWIPVAFLGLSSVRAMWR
mmetsp:Transcript_47635/g.110351  ORF Transcript_47635/g.110351 Transcript_47635/m.110351 type:complete len:304 (-) Transcript_47635:116-1027(-)